MGCIAKNGDNVREIVEDMSYDDVNDYDDVEFCCRCDKPITKIMKEGVDYCYDDETDNYWCGDCMR